MVSIQDVQKLNQNDIATITLFVDRIRRTKGNYNTTQQALIQLVDEHLFRIVEAYRTVHAPATGKTQTLLTLSDRRLQRARESLLALQAEIMDQELKKRVNQILAILRKLG